MGLVRQTKIHGNGIDKEKGESSQDTDRRGSRTDRDWVECFQANNFAIVEYLLLLGPMEDAVTILAHAGNLYPQLWADYVISDRRLRDVLKTTVATAERVRRCFLAENEVQITYKHYIGYDRRDSVTYGTVIQEEEDDEENVQIEDENEVERRIVMVHLLVVFNIFACEVPYLKAKLAQGQATSRVNLAQVRVTDKELATLRAPRTPRRSIF